MCALLDLPGVKTSKSCRFYNAFTPLTLSIVPTLCVGTQPGTLCSSHWNAERVPFEAYSHVGASQFCQSACPAFGER